ncbi:DsbA family protein [Cetobacterium somerae]|uniref:DsbA family oxidoreductase n=1 Tax=Cetobacterium sp. NK01 TaxID=2993530 RepID=UPI0021169FED|nr:DsbA family protein [Cetobacterium sp. NK01]MCQ8211356.1 DsbA family protein [Cetobacterium sp. NK01]
MKISIILDFVCPYCFVGEKILEKALKEKNLNPEFRFLPYELSPEPKPQPIVNEASKEYFQKNIVNWAKDENININFPTISPKPRTALAFEGIYVAEKYNKGIEYVRAVLEAYWLHNKDIGNVEILIEIADNLLIPKFEFADALLSGKFKAVHKKLNDEVSDLDFDVVPTFYINEKQLANFPRTTKEWLEILK